MLSNLLPIGKTEEQWPCSACGALAKIRTPREGDMLLKGPMFNCSACDFEFQVDWPSIHSVNRAHINQRLEEGVRAGVITEATMLATQFELERVQKEVAEMEAKPWRGL